MGQSLVFMPECHSTNDEASLLIRQGKVMEGTVVITDNQLSGKGQRGNSWIAEQGKNLTFSVILNPTFLPVSDQFALSKAITLGLLDYLKATLDMEIKIKWPNDIMVQNKKVCGVLIENSVSVNRLQHSVVGIGLNVNQEKFEFDTASSMAVFACRKFQLDEVLEQVLEQLEYRYLMLRQRPDELKAAYLENMFWLNERHTFLTQSEKFEGEITGVDESGRLMINSENGIETFDLKEVQYVF
jgi:BirA family biotin operon repressor/biotin-[acetyl-CoA-carboxylase] ligase